jgi:phosphohistidine phosphatase
VQLLIVRHAVAEDKELFERTGQSDDLRPLTDEGKKRMRRVARGLARMVEPDLLVSSPLVRAVQTGEILSKAFDLPLEPPVEALRPDKAPEAFGRWAATLKGKSMVAVVGHEPHLTRLVAWLTAGRPSVYMKLKKGGACLLEFDRLPRQSAGTLLWLAEPSQLADRSR